MVSNMFLNRSPDWLIWDGWTFVSTAAQVLSLVAIAIALFEVLRQRRRFPPAFLTADIIGFETVKGERREIMEISNFGTSAVAIYTMTLVGAELSASTLDERMKWALGSSERATVRVKVPDAGTSWLLIQYASIEDHRFVRWEWQPLAKNGKADADYTISAEATPRRYWWKPWQRWTLRPAPVGPGGRIATRVRVQQKSAALEADNRAAMSIMLAHPASDRATYSPGLFLPEIEKQ